ncbi:hypothetical protein MEO93_28925, partial [Dolichospermum sp. ST_sed3]|nr:hypothetical protein [Dolichospermum sp. ST_sed3]
VTTSSNPQAPGQLKIHYAPSKNMILGDLAELIRDYGPERVGVLSFQNPIAQVNQQNQVTLSTSGNLEEAARKLFASLRELDKMDVDIILAEEVPSIGLGRAINDRLRRAAAG